MMSTRNGNKSNHYYYKKENGSEYRFDGIGQLEAGTKCIMSLLADKGESVDRIVIMTTKEAEVDTEFYIRQIENFSAGYSITVMK